MQISNNAKKILKAASSSEPELQGKFYSCYTLAKNKAICSESESLDCVKALEGEGLVSVPYSSSPHLFQLTDYGRHYAEIRFRNALDFFTHSILCPIVVTLITEAIIHGLPILLQLLSHKG